MPGWDVCIFKCFPRLFVFCSLLSSLPIYTIASSSVPLLQQRSCLLCIKRSFMPTRMPLSCTPGCRRAGYCSRGLIQIGAAIKCSNVECSSSACQPASHALSRISHSSPLQFSFVSCRQSVLRFHWAMPCLVYTCVICFSLFVLLQTFRCVQRLPCSE